MWDTAEARLALLELLCSKTLKRRKSQSTVFDFLAELSWTRSTGRRDELSLIDTCRPELVSLLERVWSGWADGLAALTAHGLPPTPDGWRQLNDVHRADALPALPERLNRRTAAALAAPHSKAVMTEARRKGLGNTEATHDGLLRLRPPQGLLAKTKAGSIDLHSIAGVLDEVAIPERAFLDGLYFEGTVRAVLLIENLGAWRDIPAPKDWLLVHVPGWDTATVGYLLEEFAAIAKIHFGDLDPNGMRIYFHLRQRWPDLIWFVPPFWSDYADDNALHRQWPANLDPTVVPQLVRELASRKLWLEQEKIIFDPRLSDSLIQLVEPVA